MKFLSLDTFKESLNHPAHHLVQIQGTTREFRYLRRKLNGLLSAGDFTVLHDPYRYLWNAPDPEDWDFNNKIKAYKANFHDVLWNRTMVFGFRIRVDFKTDRVSARTLRGMGAWLKLAT